MFGWLAQKVQKASVKSQEGELLTFIQSLKGMTQDELASLVVIATRQRMTFPEFGVHLTEFLDGGAPPGHEAYALRVGSAIRQFQKDGDLAAAGALMIWIHSVRAVLSPPLRIHGKRVWLELMRGFPSVTYAWLDLASSGLALPGVVTPTDCEYVPTLLDPSLK